MSFSHIVYECFVVRCSIQLSQGCVAAGPGFRAAECLDDFTVSAVRLASGRTNYHAGKRPHGQGVPRTV